MNIERMIDDTFDTGFDMIRDNGLNSENCSTRNAWFNIKDEMYIDNKMSIQNFIETKIRNCHNISILSSSDAPFVIQKQLRISGDTDESLKYLNSIADDIRSNYDAVIRDVFVTSQTTGISLVVLLEPPVAIKVVRDALYITVYSFLCCFFYLLTKL